jgi:signal transduction histidine kinase/CheY-like chemotaxis protein
MKTLLVLAQHPELAETLRSGLNPEQYRVVSRSTVEEAEPLLVHGLADVCIVDVDLTNVQGAWVLERLRRRAPKCPLIVFTGEKQPEWEEEAYLQGAAHVFAKPVRLRMFNSLLDRLLAAPAVVSSPAPSPPLPPELSHAIGSFGVEKALPHSPPHALEVLRDFSSILTHSLNAEGMFKQFLLLLREILSVNRAAIFLRQPLAAFTGPAGSEEARRLRAVCAVGLPGGLLQHFELSFEAGIGGHLIRSGRILKRASEEARNDLETQKEFELLGAQVAVPILDREMVLGVAVFDGRITGEPLTNAELQLVFHLLEQLGLAIKNIWLHDQVASNHEMMAGILRELTSACVVVSRDLTILHANKMARKYFGRSERRGGDLDFTNLPQVLGAKVYQVLKTGAGITHFRYEPDDSPGTVYNVNIVPFQRPQAGLPASALLMAEDLTQAEQLRKLEMETAALRQLRAMATALTHEMGNAMVPLSVHQQMLAEMLSRKKVDVEALKVMERDWADGVKRTTRFIDQMRFLAQDTLLSHESFAVSELIEEACEQARQHVPGKTVQIDYQNGGQPTVLTGDRKALKHAFSEILLNALQANPANSRIGIHLEKDLEGGGNSGLCIEIEDSGAGFSSEALQKAFLPFFTTRNVGLGLGLTVSKKIIETHHGKVEIVPPNSGKTGKVRVSLPLDPGISTAA